MTVSMMLCIRACASYYAGMCTIKCTCSSLISKAALAYTLQRKMPISKET